MEGKKRTGADEPKQPKPKQPEPNSGRKPDNLGWVGPVLPCLWRRRHWHPVWVGGQGCAAGLRKVVERANSGKPANKVSGKVVTVDEFCTSRVSLAMNSPQPCERKLDRSKPTRPEGWKPKPGQVQHRLLRSAWSQRLEAPVRGLMWCPWLHQTTPGGLGIWVDRDCNAALNFKRAGESKWRPLELCRWPHRGAAPAKGKEYPALGFKKMRDRAPKAQA